MQSMNIEYEIDPQLAANTSAPDAGSAANVTQLAIKADDGRDLFTIQMNEDGTIEVRAGLYVKHQEKILSSALAVIPHSTNSIRVMRIEEPGSVKL